MSVLAALALTYLAGVGMGLLLPAPWWAALAAATFGIGVSIAALANRRLAASSVLGAALALGWARPDEERVIPRDPPGGRPCERVVQGRVASHPIRVGEDVRFEIGIAAATACLGSPGPIRLMPAGGTLFVAASPIERPDARRGDLVRLRAEIRPLPIRRNPGLPSRSSDGGAVFARLARAGSLARVESARANPIHVFDAARESLSAFWISAAGPVEAGLARALTLGEDAALDPKVREHFRRTGTAHLLAVSGMNLGLVVLVVYGALRFALLRVRRISDRMDVGRIAAAVSIPATLAFALLTGFEPPIARACVMSVTLLAARALGRRGNASEAIALAAAGLAVHDPSVLLDPGFQLSFAAVLGLLLPAGRPDPGDAHPAPAKPPSAGLRLTRSALRALRLLAVATLAASAATTPIVLYHFGSFSLVTLPANLVAVPYSSFVLMPYLLVVTILAGIAPGVAALVARPAEPLIAALDRFLGGLAALPCTIDDPAPPAVAALGLLSLATLLWLGRLRRPAALACAGAALCLAVALASSAPPFPPGRLTLDFLDVGEGDATLVTFPGGAHWLVDAGGTPQGEFDVGERVVVPVLRALGVRRLDAFVLSHPDSDHVGGAAAVISAVDTTRIWDNGQGQAEGAGPAYERLLAVARSQGAIVERTPRICGAHSVQGVTVEVLHPCKDKNGFDPGLTFNDNSIVLALRHKGVRILLPGDIESGQEDRLVRGGALGRADLVKLAHHGSRTSSGARFLDAASPRVAIASVGAWNRFGFPHREVLGLMASRHVAILRTDRDGAVRAVSDGRTLSIETQRQDP
ncbi:MAG: DNA internalization-related competence protein ComEC/Rec2 [Deltaproteobacteria bacterium]|nr:DNA internalization-related competence protein ComEC/Rec2 [Deltaproteobacteria bacterium]